MQSRKLEVERRKTEFLKEILQFEFNDDIEESILKLFFEIAKGDCSSVDKFDKIRGFLQ